MPGSFRQIIDSAVADKRFLVVPGAHDALSARLIEKTGFETYFIGGFPAVGARYGLPDIGLKGFGEISACVRDIMAACDLPVFVDGDDGYGDVKNVVHTVQSYERMGVSAILIEDQQWPKRCGHMVGKKVVPTEVAEAKIRAACAERLDRETWILARTDARAVYDLDEAMRRAERYIRAGADGIFIEAPRSVKELEIIGKAFDVPQVCNPWQSSLGLLSRSPFKADWTRAGMSPFRRELSAMSSPALSEGLSISARVTTERSRETL
jgi:2,3-dimethylmalate lyase